MATPGAGDPGVGAGRHLTTGSEPTMIVRPDGYVWWAADGAVAAGGLAVTF